MQQPSESYRLVVRRGPQPNQTYDLNKDIITIGRDITNDIVINDPEVSRHHMRFTRGATGFTLEDLGSTNGTFVNGQRITGVRPLNPGDMIGLGETVTLGYENARPLSPAGAPVYQPSAPEPLAPAAPAAANPFARPAAPAPQQQVAPVAPVAPAPVAPQAPQPIAPLAQQPQAVGYGYNNPASPAASPYAVPPQAPPAGYDYDPYAAREDDPRSTTRWILIGCAVLFVLCCCSVVIGLVLIDQLNLWDSIPILKDTITPLLRNLAGGG